MDAARAEAAAADESAAGVTVPEETGLVAAHTVAELVTEAAWRRLVDTMLDELDYAAQDGDNGVVRSLLFADLKEVIGKALATGRPASS